MMQTDPRFLSLTGVEIEKEWWRLHFHNLLQAGGKPGEQILESHGDEAFAEFVEQLEKEAEEKEASARATNNSDFEDYK